MDLSFIFGSLTLQFQTKKWWLPYFNYTQTIIIIENYNIINIILQKYIYI